MDKEISQRIMYLIYKKKKKKVIVYLGTSIFVPVSTSIDIFLKRKNEVSKKKINLLK